MKRLLTLSLLLLVASNGWADEHEVSGSESWIQVCEVNVGRKSIEGLEMCKKGDHLLEIGGASYISSLFDGVPRLANIDHYANIVKEKAVQRVPLDCML